MSSTITPTIGRRVWYWPSGRDVSGADAMDVNGQEQPCDAGVCFVYSDRMVNLTVADHAGNMHRRMAVTLVQPGDERPREAHATWMPYQVGQARERADVGSVAAEVAEQNVPA